MKYQIDIENSELINEILNDVSFGTLALCNDKKPYSVPLNFVSKNDIVYFHGAKKGKKISFIKDNANASFSVVKDYSLIPSYFSSTNNLACPATHFFKSIIINGKIEFVENYEEKVLAFQALMEKLQLEGKYISLNDKNKYEKMINATCVYKLIPEEIKGKIKLGQKLTPERFEMVVEHLKQRDTKLDKLTLKEMLKNML